MPEGQICCDPQWEAAYQRFETPEQEIAKFIKRLKRFGFENLPKEIRIAEIFCGRGGGLVALERLGFNSIEGVDLSDSLLEQYRGPATLHLANCMNMPFDSGTFDAVVVHGGLHHLPKLPADLDQTLSEVARITKPGGKFYAVEPWRTPFLSFAHFVTELSFMRRLYAKGDALAIMTERERVTYEQWLDHSTLILKTFAKHFRAERSENRWGKLSYIGQVD